MTRASKTTYLWIRDLHLYFGLFLSPYVLLFAVSTVFLNHPGLLVRDSGSGGLAGSAVVAVEVPQGLERLEGMDRVDKVRPILRQAGISGEIGSIRYLAKESRMVVSVMKPGEEVTLDLNLAAGRARVERRTAGLRDALVYLHKSPGPHLANIRGNWSYTRLWKWLVDGTVYVLLFISISGIYLWAVLRAERKIGFVLLGAGAASFAGVIYVLAA